MNSSSADSVPLPNLWPENLTICPGCHVDLTKEACHCSICMVRGCPGRHNTVDGRCNTCGTPRVGAPAVVDASKLAESLRRCLQVIDGLRGRFGAQWEDFGPDGEEQHAIEDARCNLSAFDLLPGVRP